jgi:hypothetical protein
MFTSFESVTSFSAKMIEYSSFWFSLLGNLRSSAYFKYLKHLLFLEHLNNCLQGSQYPGLVVTVFSLEHPNSVTVIKRMQVNQQPFYPYIVSWDFLIQFRQLILI